MRVTHENGSVTDKFLKFLCVCMDTSRDFQCNMRRNQRIRIKSICSLQSTQNKHSEMQLNRRYPSEHLLSADLEPLLQPLLSADVGQDLVDLGAAIAKNMKE